MIHGNSPKILAVLLVALLFQAVSFGAEDEAKPIENNPLNKEALAKKVDRVIDVIMWDPNYEADKESVTYYVRGTEVATRFDRTYPPIKNPRMQIDMEAQRIIGRFKGTIAGNTITGEWNIKALPHKTFQKGPKVQYEIETSSTTTQNMKTVLEEDGTVTVTATGKTVMNYKRGPNAPEVCEERPTRTIDCSIPPSPECKPPGAPEGKPYTGTWKDWK